MNCWQTLGLDPTGDKKVIKKAYIHLVKQYPPEDHPERFQEIRAAYEAALAWAAKVGPGGPVVTASRTTVTITKEAPPDPAPPFPAGDLGGGFKPPDMAESLGANVHKGADPLFERPLEPGASPRSLPEAVREAIEAIEADLGEIDEAAALARFEETMGRFMALSDRLRFAEALYHTLSWQPTLPMDFTAAVIVRLGWDAKTDQQYGGRVLERYHAVNGLKHSFDKAPPRRICTLRRGYGRSALALLAFSHRRRKYMEKWLEALEPYLTYFPFLGVDASAVAAWRKELDRPQFPDRDYVYALFFGLLFGIVAGRSLPGNAWFKLGGGVLLWAVFFLLLLLVPVFRWAAFKWREDWRPGATGSGARLILDLIPVGILALLAMASQFCFLHPLNIAALGFFSFALYLCGLLPFLSLSLVTAALIWLLGRGGAEISAPMVWFALFGGWLKIRLTLLDRSSVGEGAASVWAFFLITGLGLCGLLLL